MGHWGRRDAVKGEALERPGFEFAATGPFCPKTALSGESMDGLCGDSLGQKHAGVRHAAEERRDLRRADIAQSTVAPRGSMAGISEGSRPATECGTQQRGTRRGHTNGRTEKGLPRKLVTGRERPG